MSQIEIPNKLFFRIGEVCKLLQLEPYVLRFWETEFPTLAPTKGANGRRMYRKKDVEMVCSIKTLLYEHGFTIAGAKKVLSNRNHELQQDLLQQDLERPRPVRQAASSPRPASIERLDRVKADLRGILTLLNRRC